MTTTQQEVAVRQIEIALIDPHPENARGKITAESVTELAASMRAQGLLQPIRLEPGLDDAKRFRVRFGHRRLAAAKVLKWKTIPAIVVESSTRGEDYADLLSENQLRADADPVREAGLVQRLLDMMDATQESVAERLGRSVEWVARRANLRTLAPGVVKAHANSEVFRSWKIGWLEEIALLSPEGQLEFLGVDDKGRSIDGSDVDDVLLDIVTMDELRAKIADRLRSLDHAQWDLGDPKLVPAVGPCTTCRQHTRAAEVCGLFDEPVDDGTEKGLQGARCRNAVCFAGKASAAIAAKVGELKAKHGSALGLARGGERSMEGVHELTLPEGVDVAYASELTARSKAAGGRPWLFIGGGGPGKVRWMARGNRGGAGPSGKVSLEVKRERLEKKRRAAFFKVIGEELGRMPAVEALGVRRPDGGGPNLWASPYREMEGTWAFSPERALRWIAAFGTVRLNWYAKGEVDAATGVSGFTGPVPRQGYADDVEMALRPEPAEGSPELLAEHVWVLIRLSVREALDEAESALDQDAFLVGTLISNLLELETEDLWKQVVDENPEPKSWAKEAEAGS